jgi:hypothetical protein
MNQLKTMNNELRTMNQFYAKQTQFKPANDAPKSAHFSLLFFIFFNFSIFAQKHPNPMYNKDLHNFSLQNTLQERNLPAIRLAGKNAKRTQFLKIRT